MDTQTSTPSEQPEPKSRREARWERRQARRTAMGSPSKAGGLIAGFLLIILGAVFLLQNYGNFITPLKNWGALFLLVPAVIAFDRSYRVYRNAGNHFNAQARGAAFVGLILLAVTVIILFNLNWTIWGPVLVILVGAALLFSVFFPGKAE